MPIPKYQSLDELRDEFAQAADEIGTTSLYARPASEGEREIADYPVYAANREFRWLLSQQQVEEILASNDPPELAALLTVLS
ncbi:hypothetical protein [Novosphingobium sp. ST904]|uniref:hypothetical protein n=1 Tax=Novosphingobium sp. ST904 TaxID=1684385 RepID=UPI0006C85D5F|nr:hypothetical protein [Novosphingobium sp. ST904]KPH59194.1 hypothetical protein ADT71_23930 [Novosphingobium sp. ST904]TCM37718.1 hypothetical protein EDF59_110114 [Novosphingobium sp. ST904]